MVTSTFTRGKKYWRSFFMGFHKLSNAFYRFSLHCPEAELDEGRFDAPSPSRHDALGDEHRHGAG